MIQYRIERKNVKNSKKKEKNKKNDLKKASFFFK